MLKIDHQFRFSQAEAYVAKGRERINGRLLTVAEWAERYREVVRGPNKGRWSNVFTPYASFVMELFTRPWIREIYLVWGPQTGKTQSALNCMMYTIDQSPGPIMYLMPDEKVARRISSRQILPAFRGTHRINRLLSKKSSDITKGHIVFENGADLMMAWAGSPAAIASESVEYFFADEPAKYPEFSGKEADTFSLARQRMIMYAHTYKLMAFSTPNEAGDPFFREIEASIDVAYEHELPCPKCGTFQFMDFKNFTWPKDAKPQVVSRKTLGRYRCIDCGMEWDDRVKFQQLQKGRWSPDKKIDRPAAVKLHLPSWYGPLTSLSKPVANYLKAKRDPTKMMAHITQDRAEFWGGQAQDGLKTDDILKHKCSMPPGVVPDEAVALTMGVDTQQDHFWFVIRAWAPDLTSWLIQYGRIGTFSDIKDIVFYMQFPKKSGGQPLNIWRCAIDTGGGPGDTGEWSRTEEVYEFIRLFGCGTVFGIKGSSRPRFKRITISHIDQMQRSRKPIPGGLDLRFLDTDKFKDLLHERLKRKEGETQRFYLHAETGEDYAKQILAEQKRKDRSGKVSYKVLSRMNHLLDCEIYAAACADNEWWPPLQLLARQGTAEQAVQNIQKRIKKADRPAAKSGRW